MQTILVVDDEALMRNFLVETLQRSHYEVKSASCVTEGIALLDRHSFDLVITDMRMPDGSGIDILRRLHEKHPNTLSIVITAFGTIENAVEAMRLGAFNYLIKPFSPDSVEAVIKKAEEHARTQQENQFLRREVHQGSCRNRHEAIFHSKGMQQLCQQVKQIAKSHANVFITGESGVGKEVIAKMIHEESLRAHCPYIRVNCAAVPETLIESEFFGYEKGSFTGAHQKRLGRFELAHRGSILLDEVTEIPIALQTKLLRVVQEKEIERVGGSKCIPIDVRIISTSNRCMQEAIEEKILREDLFYRLNVIPIHVPPLRERVEDIVPLAEFFLKQLCQENHKRPKQLQESAKQLLCSYFWPGNVRELVNVIERCVVLEEGMEIEASHISLKTAKREMDVLSSFPCMTLKKVEEKVILRTLQQQDNDRKQAAEILGISLRSLNGKIRQYGVV